MTQEMIEKIHASVSPLSDRVSKLEQHAKHMESQNSETREAVRELDLKMERQHDRLYNTIENKFDRLMNRMDENNESLNSKFAENSKQITRILAIGTSAVVIGGLVFSALNWLI
jgi:predicted RNase H-like nuclease (RuvC/YqgF family)